MINVICDCCKNELDDFGGLIFSPPRFGSCEKLHLCKNCYHDLSDFISKFEENKRILNAIKVQTNWV